MSYGNQGYRQQATMAASPFADSFRKDLSSMQGNPQFMGGLGTMLQKYREKLGDGNMVGSLSQGTPDPMPMNLSRGTENFYAVNRPQQPRPANPFLNQLGRVPLTQGPENAAQPAQLQPTRPEPVNPFAENEQYQALMEYQKSMAPSQEQQDRLSELRTAFEGTGGYKDYRIQQMEQQMQRMRQQPRMGMGLGGMRPTGMGMFGGFPQQPQRQFGQMPVPRGGYNQYNRGPMQQPNFMQQPNPNNYGGYGMQQAPQQQYQMPQPQYQPYQNPYQQAQPQPQQFGGYGMGQSMGGYGGYGGMSNPYQPQQFGQQSMSQPQQFKWLRIKAFKFFNIAGLLLEFFRRKNTFSNQFKETTCCCFDIRSCIVRLRKLFAK